MLQTQQEVSNLNNHPLATRMAIIAFITNNLTIACVWGSFSVMLVAVETRLGVGRELSSLGAPAVNLASCIFAPLAGILATRYSLWLIMVGGAALSVCGFALLALTKSYPLYLVAFGLLLGAGMGVGLVLPATLVTRWYSVNRGRALGIVGAPIALVLMPFVSIWSLQSYGVAKTYAVLAAISLISLIANCFVTDRPPEDSLKAANAPGAQRVGHEAVMTMTQFLRTPRFWGLVFPFVASASGSIMLSTHIVPMLRSWGFSTALGASLLAIQSAGGIAGTIIFGWITDRLGGALALTIVAFDAAILWMLLLVHPSFIVTAVVVGLIGAHGAGVVPVFSLALSQAFGRESFSRAYGLTSLVNLPFAALCVPFAAIVFTDTGSYTGAIIGEAAFLGATSLLGLLVWRRRPVAPAAAVL